MKSTVLIADDEPSLRRLVRATIASDSYQLVEAENGDAAWELLRAQRPVLAILDVAMPGRSGLDLVRAIRADPDLTGIRVILLTAKAQQTDMTAGMAAGADYYLAKPFSPLELLTLVDKVMHGE